MNRLRRGIIVSLFIALVSPMCFAGDQVESETAQKGYKIGDTVEPFTLQCQEGHDQDLSEILGKKIVVLDFWNMQCPVSKGFEEQLKGIAKAYEEKEVVFYAIDSNTINSVEAIKKYAEENKLNYAVLKDIDNKIADKFDAAVTPEVFVIGKDKTIQYHGAISDNMDPTKIQHHYLTAALDSLLEGKPVEVKESKAFGCGIKRTK